MALEICLNEKVARETDPELFQLHFGHTRHPIDSCAMAHRRYEITDAHDDAAIQRILDRVSAEKKEHPELAYAPLVTFRRRLSVWVSRVAHLAQIPPEQRFYFDCLSSGSTLEGLGQGTSWRGRAPTDRALSKHKFSHRWFDHGCRFGLRSRGGGLPLVAIGEPYGNGLPVEWVRELLADMKAAGGGHRLFIGPDSPYNPGCTITVELWNARRLLMLAFDRAAQDTDQKHEERS